MIANISIRLVLPVSKKKRLTINAAKRIDENLKYIALRYGKSFSVRERAELIFFIILCEDLYPIGITAIVTIIADSCIKKSKEAFVSIMLPRLLTYKDTETIQTIIIKNIMPYIFMIDL